MDRGDRPELYNFCIYQLSRMTAQPTETFLINHPPVSDAVDIVLRVRLGIAAAERAGIDICYIVESDDYYPPDYFERMAIGDNDFIGAAKTIYYNIKSNTYQEQNHPARASLCFTGFRISALKGFSWPPDDMVFLDLALWRHAQKKRYNLLPHAVGLGIKHGMGMTGGKGHRMKLKNADPDMEFLKSQVDSEAFDFYKDI